MLLNIYPTYENVRIFISRKVTFKYHLKKTKNKFGMNNDASWCKEYEDEDKEDQEDEEEALLIS